MYGMKRTTVYLTDDLRSAVKRVARSEGVSEASVIRDAIAGYTAARARPRPRLGIFDSGKPWLSEDTEAALEGFGSD